MLSPSLEDYLEEVYRLSLKEKDIRNKDIADTLNVSMPSVVKGLKKLKELNYIKYEPYEKIEVLEKGERKGKFLVERNRILREFVDIIGSSCDEKAEAEAMEHYLCIDTIRSIEKLVSFFMTYPEIREKFNIYNVSSILDEDDLEYR
ncbi:metal-dependent transcriptional regulator [Senegalia massiliensis]|jgi:Mn-dependent DtxR family transcriptional regulator|uniref:metal-dependent transcriptional regulator n=1 Tax=Senegalia massiliensis TaxID=1720316 RepID=UPI001030E393|nr:iron dependent repressor, metal binding and dimerization domain protein [Senegalia massiliensis]